MNIFIITSILGLIFLGIGLAMRFKIRSDQKKGIFHEDTYKPGEDEEGAWHKKDDPIRGSWDPSSTYYGIMHDK